MRWRVIAAVVCCLLPICFADGGAIDPMKLRPGSIYTISRKTPVMPEVEPKNPIESIRHMRHMAPGSGLFIIGGVEDSRGSLWYSAVAVSENDHPLSVGWVNSGALLGQSLRKGKGGCRAEISEGVLLWFCGGKTYITNTINGSLRSRQERATQSASGLVTFYSGNTKSMIFHSPKCDYYDCPNCTETFRGREAAIDSGYRPCRVCNP